MTRLIAWCQLNHMEITLASTQQCLKQFIDMQVRKITIEAIQRAVSENFGMRLADLKQKNNSRNVVVPRQIAMYLAKQMTEASLPEIGRQFGNKHHTTVMHSIAKIDEQRRDRQGPAPHAEQAAGAVERVAVERVSKTASQRISP